MPGERIEPLNDSTRQMLDRLRMWGELHALVSEALEQYDAGQAVDLEQRYTEFVRRWVPDAE